MGPEHTKIDGVWQQESAYNDKIRTKDFNNIQPRLIESNYYQYPDVIDALEMKVRLGEATQQDVDQYNNDIEEHTMTQVDNNTLIERGFTAGVAEIENYSYPEPKNQLSYT